MVNKSGVGQFVRRASIQKLRYVKGTIALVLAVIALSACENFQQRETAAPRDNVTTEEVANRTAQLIGKTVTIRSKPIKKLSESTFSVSDQQFFGGETILIVNASGKPFVLPTDQNVEIQATGQVRRFVYAEFERDYDLFSPADVYAEFEGKPAIVAQAIALAPEPGQVTENPRLYYNKTIAVTGEIENLTSPTAFTLDEDQLFGDQDLLVINAKARTAGAGEAATAPVSAGQTVAVTGVLRPFVVAEIERDYDLGWDLETRRKLEVEYSNRPVLVATGIYPSAIPEARK